MTVHSGRDSRCWRQIASKGWWEGFVSDVVLDEKLDTQSSFEPSLSRQSLIPR
jgi:hypothetical protein